MWDEVRDHFQVILLVDVSEDDTAKLGKGNESSTLISYNTGSGSNATDIRCEDGFRSDEDFQVAAKRVDR